MTWTGTYALPASATPVQIVVAQHGRTATVSLGPGHSWSQDVAVGASGTRVRFTLPAGVVFDGVRHEGKWHGFVRQGRLRGTFSLSRGLSRVVQLLGAYRSASGAGVAITEADGLPATLTELPSGAMHGIGPSLTVGKLLGDTRGNGSIAVDATGFTWNRVHYARLHVHQREVRVGVDAATLTLPPGSGPFSAVAMVHGSGPRTRDEFDIFTAYFALKGVAVIADDKRGVGESGGAYPGDLAAHGTIELLAGDARAEVGLLVSLKQVDSRRVGLFGDSQAGWIVPVAAAGDAAVRWAILNSGPTVTVGESDYWGSLAGESESQPSGTRAQMLAQVRAGGPSGFDPAPALRALSIPVLWMYGSDDRNVPTELCVERLATLRPGHDFSWIVLQTAHTPIRLPTGLLSSLPQSPGFDPRFFPSLDSWLRDQSITH
jgi:pimeloyl-ACP methyl ester carboxylesterase